ncbi:MAG: MBL fold metallo-hydrolase [Candidatus Kapabacteria bacterium]|nr:MBL fold metallo-hydrolase [Candidatus Kapabacteria bacterium]
MIIVAIVVGVLSVSAIAILQLKAFGKMPSGKRLERVKRSPQYHDGKFHNASSTPMMTGDNATWETLTEFLSSKNTEPPKPIPSVKTDLKALPDSVPTLVWFGHSGYLLHVDGKNILVDPIFAESIAPVPWFMKSYAGTSVYSVDDLPPLDAVIITHDHYDHLNYETITKIIAKTKHFYTALGVGEHLAYWGVDEQNITELDWWEKADITSSISLTATPARHFSGRGIINDKTLWASFALTSSQAKIYIGGDSGYDTHFKTIGERFGPFDLVMLECGQYNKKWALIHLMPEETVQASLDLKATALMPMHWGRFTLASHTWDEPITRLEASAIASSLALCTPLIGEPVRLAAPYPHTAWWKNVNQ